MKVIITSVTSPLSSSRVQAWIDVEGMEKNIKRAAELATLGISLICVWEDAKFFNSDKAWYSRKYNNWGFGVYLDHEYVCSSSNSEELTAYIYEKIRDRIGEVKNIKRFIGIKDRSILDDVYELFKK